MFRDKNPHWLPFATVALLLWLLLTGDLVSWIGVAAGALLHRSLMRYQITVQPLPTRKAHEPHAGGRP